MKLKLLAKLAAVILFAASPFFVYAEFECLPLTGSTQLMSVSSIGCPARAFNLVGTTQCEVILADQSGGQGNCIGLEGMFFGNYRYTGSVFGETENPYTPPELPPLETELETPTVALQQTPTQDSGVTQNFLKVAEDTQKLVNFMSVAHGVNTTNLDKIYDAIRQTFEDSHETRHAAIMARNAAMNNQQATYDARSAALNAAAMAGQTQSLMNGMRLLVEQDINEGRQFHEDSTELLTTQFDDLKDHVSTEVYATRQILDDRIELSKQAILTAVEAGGSTNDYTPMLQSINDTVNSNSNDIANLTSVLGQVASGCISDGRGGWDCSGPDSVDMSQTNDLLSSLDQTASQSSELLDDIESNTDRLRDDIGDLEDTTRDRLNTINQTLLDGFAGGTGGGTGGGSNTENLQAIESVLWDSHDLHSQNAQSLSDISGTLQTISNPDTTGLAQQLSDTVTDANSELSTDMDSFYEQFNTESKMSELETTVSGMVRDSGLSDYDTLDKVRNSLSDANTVSQIFDVSRASCSPYQFWEKSIDFCPAAQKSSMVLEYFIWAITAIFGFLHITGFLTKLRTE